MCGGRWGWTEDHQQLNVASIPVRFSFCSAGSGIAHMSQAEIGTYVLPRKRKLLDSWSISKNFYIQRTPHFIKFFSSLENRQNFDLCLVGIFLFSCLNDLLNGAFSFVFLFCWFGFFHRIKIVTSLCSYHLLSFILFPFLPRLDSVLFCCFLMCSWCEFILAMHLMSLVSVTSS